MHRCTAQHWRRAHRPALAPERRLPRRARWRQERRPVAQGEAPFEHALLPRRRDPRGRAIMHHVMSRPAHPLAGRGQHLCGVLARCPLPALHADVRRCVVWCAVGTECASAVGCLARRARCTSLSTRLPCVVVLAAFTLPKAYELKKDEADALLAKVDAPTQAQAPSSSLVGLGSAESSTWRAHPLAGAGGGQEAVRQVRRGGAQEDPPRRPRREEGPVDFGP